MKNRQWIQPSLMFGLALFLLITNARAQQTVQSSAIRPQSVTGDLVDLRSLNDDRLDTRAYSTSRNYTGKSIVVDVGTMQNIIGVSQDHGRWPTHYPGAYKIEVAESLQGPWFPAWEGEGQRGESKAKFAAILARYVRITAINTNPVYDEDWTIAELRIGIDPGQRPRRIPTGSGNDNNNTTPPGRESVLRDPAAARDRNEETFAVSGTPNYVGMSITFDLGREVELSRVIQFHGSRVDDYPGEYRIEVSRIQSDRGFQEVFRGAGQSNRSVARFTPTRARYIRLTATRNRNNVNWWSIAELRTDADETQPGRDDTDTPDTHAIRNVTGRGFVDLNTLLDRDSSTGPTTNTSNYRGSYIQVDLGNIVPVSRIVQIHNPYQNDFPGRYRVEVSTDGGNWQNVYEGTGAEGRSVAEFRTARARYVRITATEPRDNRNWWSIYRLKIRGSGDITPPPGRGNNDTTDNYVIGNVNGRGFTGLDNLLDPNRASRATTNTPAYRGSWVEVDLGSIMPVSQVVQVHNPNVEDFPGRYSIEVSTDGRNWQNVYEGAGEQGRSVAQFRAIRTRFVRITALETRNTRNWWSLQQVRIRG